MLPNKKQKHKTKIRSGENPQYMESFLLHRVNPEEVNNMGLRVRIYGCERLRKERLIGEAYVSFATIDLELETNLWLPLEPRSTASVSILQLYDLRYNFFLIKTHFSALFLRFWAPIVTC